MQVLPVCHLRVRIFVNFKKTCLTFLYQLVQHISLPPVGPMKNLKLKLNNLHCVFLSCHWEISQWPVQILRACPSNARLSGVFWCVMMLRGVMGSDAITHPSTTSVCLLASLSHLAAQGSIISRQQPVMIARWNTCWREDHRGATWRHWQPASLPTSHTFSHAKSERVWGSESNMCHLPLKQQQLMLLLFLLQWSEMFH